MLSLKTHLFFDLDGVLADTRQIHCEAFTQALLHRGIVIEIDEHLSKFDGLPTKKKLDHLKEIYKLRTDEIIEIDLIKQSLTLELINNKISKDLDLIDILKELKKDFQMAVCSNARRETLDLTLEKIGITNLFSFTLSNNDVLYSKPSPEIYLKAIELSKVDKDKCIVFEDSSHGLISAKSSGLDFIKIQNPNEFKKFLRSYFK